MGVILCCLDIWPYGCKQSVLACLNAGMIVPGLKWLFFFHVIVPFIYSF